MKKIVLIILISISVSGCKKERGRGNSNPCISADKTTMSVNQTISISNCGSELPTQYVAAEINWGDGSKSSGQTGSHTYNATGTYSIKLMMNGEWAANAVDADPSKVKIDVIVQ